MTNHSRRRTFRGGVAIFTIAILGFILAACGDDDSASPSTTAPTAAAAPSTTEPTAPSTTATPDVQTVTIALDDFTIEAPDSVPAGLARFDVTGGGAEQHQLAVVRLNDGVTWDQVEEVLMSDNPDAAEPLVTALGGVAALDPEVTANATVELEPGSHAYMCFIHGYDGLSHLSHGMYKPFEVTEPESGTPAAAPEAKGDITLADMTITIPDDFDGEGTWHVVNEGPQGHEAILMQVAAGSTLDDVTAYLSSTTAPTGPPPVSFIGGPGYLTSGQDEWVDLDLESGDYMFVCFVPDPEQDLTPHYFEGMEAEFTVE